MLIAADKGTWALNKSPFLLAGAKIKIRFFFFFFRKANSTNWKVMLKSFYSIAYEIIIVKLKNLG